jgi:hypothetical protein
LVRAGSVRFFLLPGGFAGLGDTPRAGDGPATPAGGPAGRTAPPGQFVPGDAPGAPFPPTDGNYLQPAPVAAGPGGNSAAVAWVRAICVVVPASTWQKGTGAGAGNGPRGLGGQLYDCGGVQQGQ